MIQRHADALGSIEVVAFRVHRFLVKVPPQEVREIKSVLIDVVDKDPSLSINAKKHRILAERSPAQRGRYRLFSKLADATRAMASSIGGLGVPQPR